MPRPKSSAAAPSDGRAARPADARSIRCEVALLRPAKDASPTGATERAATWLFLHLPDDASKQLPSRGLVSVEGSLAGVPFAASLAPDGKGGHWMKVERTICRAAGVEAGDVVVLAFAPVAAEPEPTIPPRFRTALAAAPERARTVWADITPMARRDFIHWIESAKREETREKRATAACDMLAQGKRRPCCFDRSGIYGKNLTAPVADSAPVETTAASSRPAARRPSTKSRRS